MRPSTQPHVRGPRPPSPPRTPHQRHLKGPPSRSNEMCGKHGYCLSVQIKSATCGLLGVPTSLDLPYMCKNMKPLNQDSDNADTRDTKNILIRSGDKDGNTGPPLTKMQQIPTTVQMKATLTKLTLMVEIPSEPIMTHVADVPMPSIALKTVGLQ